MTMTLDKILVALARLQEAQATLRQLARAAWLLLTKIKSPSERGSLATLITPTDVVVFQTTPRR